MMAATAPIGPQSHSERLMEAVRGDAVVEDESTE